MKTWNGLLFLCTALAVFFLFACSDSDEDVERVVQFTLLQTSDLHHHASGYGPFLDYTPGDTTDDDSVIGGYARIATVVSQVSQQQAFLGNPVLLMDSGDFFMGTAYDLTAADPLALKFFQLLGYDAVTLGNHEFDWAPQGLGMLLSNSMNSAQGFDVPIVASNLVTNPDDPGDDAVEALIAAGAIVHSTIIPLGYGVEVGVIGLMGEDADVKAPVAAPVTFNHDYAAIQQSVDQLRQSGVEIVVALSHSGLTSDGGGEDMDLAENVSGIDIIASGHSHIATPSAYTVGGTVLFQPGRYGSHVCRLDVTYNATQGRIVDHAFQLIPIDDRIPGDPAVIGLLQQYHANMNMALAALGVEMTSPVSKTSFELSEMGLHESGLGNLVADSDRATASMAALASGDPTPFSMGVVAGGVIRDQIAPGNTGLVSFADVYAVVPLGISPDMTQPVPGYPLMSVYVTPAEIRNICEISAFLAPYVGDSDYFLNLSGVRFQYNPENPPFQWVTQVNLCGNAIPAAYGGDEDMFCLSCETVLDLTDTTSLHRIVVDLYALQMLSVVTSYGLSLTPKNMAGDPIDLSNPMDYMQYRIDADPMTAGMQELKEWMALLGFLSSAFPPNGDGVPPAIYGPEGLALGRMTPVMP